MAICSGSFPFLIYLLFAMTSMTGTPEWTKKTRNDQRSQNDQDPEQPVLPIKTAPIAGPILYNVGTTSNAERICSINNETVKNSRTFLVPPFPSIHEKMIRWIGAPICRRVLSEMKFFTAHFLLLKSCLEILMFRVETKKNIQYISLWP